MLVFLVMFLFLQNWRATLIPTIVVPIALGGACLGLWLAGFSINVLTLFGMVLAIGILVDDAIVVIENVERLMADEGLSPHDATVKAMGQITSAIVGITLVLIAVFIPMAFFPGSTGGIYRQFSVTLAVSIGFSALLALTLTPALCATFLKPRTKETDEPRRPNLVARGFAAFNDRFGRMTTRHHRQVSELLRRPLRWAGVALFVFGLTALLFLRLPSGFLPAEDQGYVIAVIQAPPGATTERTELAVSQAKAFFTAQPQVSSIVVVRGFSFFGQGQSNAISFVSLKPWEERIGAEDGSLSLVDRAFGALMRVREAMIFTLNPPPIQELGNASGFTFKLQDRGANGPAALLAARNQLLGAAGQSLLLTGVRPEGQEDGRQLLLEHNDPLRSRLDRADALNMHRVQGQTVDNAITVLSGEDRMLNSQSLVYVLASRARDGFTLYLDDTEKVISQIERNDGKSMHALDLEMRAEKVAPVEEPSAAKPDNVQQILKVEGRAAAAGQVHEEPTEKPELHKALDNVPELQRTRDFDIS